MQGVFKVRYQLDATSVSLLVCSVMALPTMSNQTNSTNGTNIINAEHSSLTNTTPLDMLKLFIQAFLALVGVAGNLAVCVVITRNKKRKSSTELLIRNLAVADIGVLMVIFPLTIIREKLPNDWPFGQLFCVYAYPTTEMFYGVSVWSIVSIAVERYRHLVCPLRKDRIQAMKVIKRLIFFLWIGSFLVFCLPVVFYMKYLETNTMRVCYTEVPSPEVQEIFFIYLFLAWYCFPVLIIMWSYLAISRKLDQSSLFLRSMHLSERRFTDMSDTAKNRLSLTQQRRLSQNRRVKRVLTPVVIAFATLMLPVNACRFVILYHRSIIDTDAYPIMLYMLTLCIVINSSINPIIYSFVSPGFRRGVNAFFKNRSYRISFMAGSVMRAVGQRITIRVSQRRTYSLNIKDPSDQRSARSAQTPVSLN